MTQYYPARSMQDVKQSAQSAGSMAADPLNDNLKHLQAIPTLRTLFVDEFAPNFRGFSQLQKDLPNVNIRPGLVDVDRQYHLIFLFVLNTAFFLLLAMQIQCHFSQPAARLVPNYAAPHIIPVVCLWLIGIIVHTVLLVNMDATPTAALGVNLLIWGVLCAQGLLDTLAQAVPRLRWIAFLVALALLGTIPFSLFSLPLNRSAIDWYLRGHSPVWTFLFILAGLTASFESLRRSLRLNSIYLERGISSPPLSFSPATQSAWHQEVYWRQTSLSQRREWLVRLFCRRLERAISQAELSGWRQRCNLWIAGNSGQGYLTFSLIVAFMIAFAVGVFAVFGDFPLDDISLQNPMVLAFSIFLPDLPVLVVAGVWRQRRSLFAMESLRPVSRNQFARQIANAIAWDLTPLALVYLAILSWYVIEADPQHWSWWWTGAMLMVFVARWIVVYGLTLWTITIRPNWVLLLAGVTTAYAVTFANLGLIFLQGPVLGVKHLPADLPDIGVASLAGLALGFGIVAWIISRLAYHRWQRIELV